jgi:hypothetical protein
VEGFITTNLSDSSAQGKLRGFLIRSPTPEQDRARIFDLVNDGVAADVKKKAAAYAVQHATDARLFANHYTFFIAHSPDGKSPPDNVHKAHEDKRLAAATLTFGSIALQAADTAQQAEAIVRQASGQLMFESFEAAASHLAKHPLQNQKTDRLDRYVEWARIAIAKGDTKNKTKRAQFDAGWDVPFDYTGHTLVVKLRGDGRAFISTFSPQTGSAALSDAAPYMEGVPTVGNQIRVKQSDLKQSIDKVRLTIKDEFSTNKTVDKKEKPAPTVPDPNFTPGALYSCPAKNPENQEAVTLTVVLEARRDDDRLIELAPFSYELVLNGTLKDNLTARTDFLLKQLRAHIAKRPINAGELFERAQKLLDTATDLPATDPTKPDARLHFASFAGTQLGIDPQTPSTLVQYQQFVTAQLAQLATAIAQCQTQIERSLQPTDPIAIQKALDVDKLRAEFNTLKSAVASAVDKKTAGQASSAAGKKLEAADSAYRNLIGAPAAEELKAHQEKAQRISNAFSVLQVRLVKANFERRQTHKPRATVTGELIYHLITPLRASRADFDRVGISGGHLESALKEFAKVFPEYHFVEVKQATALDTTLRLYRQFMWREENKAPPLVSEAARRPTADNPRPTDWIEAGVAKSTAEDLFGWLDQGMEAFAAWKEFDPQGPGSQRLGRLLYEGAQGDKALTSKGVEFGGRVELNKELNTFVVTQLVPHIEWLKNLT